MKNLNDRYNQILDAYTRDAVTSDLCIEHAKKQKSLRDAIAASASCADERGFKHSHQRRRTPLQLKTFSSELALKERDIRNDVKTFHDLMELLWLTDIPWFKETTQYDVATRIGAYLNLEPQFIYLHAGTREGAKNLGCDYKRKYLKKDELPEPFCSSPLSCAQLEDLLCIAKNAFKSDCKVIEFDRCIQKIRSLSANCNSNNNKLRKPGCN